MFPLFLHPKFSCLILISNLNSALPYPFVLECIASFIITIEIYIGLTGRFPSQSNQTKPNRSANLDWGLVWSL